jgi:uncharacterized GH25 family protein
MFRIWSTCCLVGILLCRSEGLAHDLWLIPPAKAEVGRKVLIEANVGMDFPNGETAADPSKWKRRYVLGPDGKELPLLPAGKRDRAALLEFTPVLPGLHTLVVETEPKVITLKADAFNSYLVSDGLPHVYRLRAKEKTLDQPATERYSKYVKALVNVGPARSGATPVVGLVLELAPLGDPLTCKVGDTLPLRVLFHGKPLPEANVGWQHPGDGPAARGYVRTDHQGQARIPIARHGLMTLRLTHMTRPKSDEYEWESFWATLTFVLPQ